MDKYIRVKDGLKMRCRNGHNLKLQVVTDEIIRVMGIDSDRDFPAASLIKYRFINDNLPLPVFKVKDDKNDVELETDKLIVRIKKSTLSIDFYSKQGKLLCSGDKAVQYFENGGYRATMELQPEEQFFGFGDQTRETIEHRGRKAIMWIRNVTGYIPIPFFMSSKGYGIMVNTTWKHYYDMGCTSKKHYFWETKGGDLDYYFFYGPDFKTILDKYTDLTGKPPLPPVWSFGLWFICRLNADDQQVMDNAQKFRDKSIPCDVIGLEPGWMKKIYDFSTKKEWDTERFQIEPWSIPQHKTFIDALKRMGYKFELWECNDYDLSIQAEREAKAFSEDKKKGNEKDRDRTFLIDEKRKTDALFPLFPGADETSPPVIMDKLTDPDKPWFEHHKKFIDMGVDFFKQDAANMYAEHPDRHWFNGMSDEEMHNLYPLLYSQQMYEGFKEHTKRRPLCFTPNGWAGLQRYTGTWAGDTGGGPKPLVASLNLAFCGHSYTTCDVDVMTKEGIHFGFLQPWTQINSFGTWDHPWLLGNKLEPVFKYYARLRYQLLPYIYSYAYEAYKTGVPIIRPMPLEFSDDKNTHNLLNQYMFGRELLIGVFTDKIYLPGGEWIDYWSGKKCKGPGQIKCSVPEDRGGSLFVRSGAIIPKVEVMNYIGEKPWDRIVLDVYPKGHSSFSLYEDDGVSFAYETGAFTITKFESVCDNERILLKIGKRHGKYKGMTKRRDYLLAIHLEEEPASVTCDKQILKRCGSGNELQGIEKNGWCFDADGKILQILLRHSGKGISSAAEHSSAAVIVLE